LPNRLPKQWSDYLKSGILHAISLAGAALSSARGRATIHRRLRAQLARANTEIALLRVELTIKDERWQRSHTRRRPHYTPTPRIRLLRLRAARGWTLEATAHAFLLDLQTLLNWMRRIDEHGERELIETIEPVNRCEDFGRHLVRAGLRLGATTIRRIVRERSAGPDDEPEITTGRSRVVARDPGHIRHVDLASVPTKAVFRVP